ncbi:MAG TPA: YraN family protein [Accumulibacter sp.]|jgi:putative endonuclease|nr:YraN family protein [Accumulibacter sp.]HQC81442.1 YraN family protein [Accumulibacter sp.]
MAISLKLNDKDNTRKAFGHSDRSRVSGARAEDLAARFLERQGLVVLARNYRCRGGEVDLICRHGRGLVFVEVRFRRSASHGGAAASIVPSKQSRLILAARHYLAGHAHGDCDCRFDCLVLDALSESAIEWIRDAFDAA